MNVYGSKVLEEYTVRELLQAVTKPLQYFTKETNKILALGVE